MSQSAGTSSGPAASPPPVTVYADTVGSQGSTNAVGGAGLHNGSENRAAAYDLPNVDDPSSAEHPLYPIAVLLDEMKNEDVSQRLVAIRRISTIALALGAQKARDFLVPLLDDTIDNEDEVLVALGEELGRFVDYIGGPNFAHILVPPLEKLATVEETVVRDKAVESLCKVAGQISTSQHVEEHCIPVLHRLAGGEWFTYRTSAAGLFAAVYQKSSPRTQEELRRMFGQLCHDETPMVRRAAATNLTHLIKKVSKEHILSEMIPLAKFLAQDDQDTVRTLDVEAVITASELLTIEEVRAHTLELFRNLSNDKSWRVRQAIAQTFVRMCRRVDPETSKNELGIDFAHLLRDTEAEVRTAAASQIPPFAGVIDQESVVQKLLPCVKDLASDASQSVRSAFATHLAGLVPVLGKNLTTEHLLPIFTVLLKDEFPEVRLNVISKLQEVNQAIGSDTLAKSLYPAIIDLVEDKQWRVRQAIIEYIPLLATQLGTSFFDDKLSGLCITWLSDPVFSVREAATVNLRKLTEVFGVDWAKINVIPKVLAMATHENYLYRLTMIFALTALAPAVGPDVIKDPIAPALVSMSTDAIPNIRFNFAKSMETLLPHLQKGASPSGQLVGGLESSIRPALLKLSEDSDNDVRYFAQRACAKAGFAAAR